jgi:non-specific serine/threonine protein kinase/serine/threonine-protein kinase
VATTLADRQRTEPRRLFQALRGELDWIVMKCLDKDRNRRYETASALAADVRHFLADEPVSAGPPSRLYRARKFVRRNKLPVIAASAVLVGLVAGLVGMAIGLISQSRQRAEAQLNLANSLHSQRKYAEAEELFRLGLESGLRSSAKDRQRRARTRLGLAKVVYDRGDATESERLHREALAAYRAAFPPGDPNIAHSLTTFGLLLRAQHRYAEAEPMFREAYEIYRRAVPADDFLIGVSARFLGSSLIPLGKYDEAELILREGIAAHRRAIPTDDWALAVNRVELGRSLILTGKFSEAEAELLEAQRALASTEDDREGVLSLAALYTRWSDAEPGQGYEAKALQWIGQLIGSFVQPEASSPEMNRDAKHPRK